MTKFLARITEVNVGTYGGIQVRSTKVEEALFDSIEDAKHWAINHSGRFNFEVISFSITQF